MENINKIITDLKSSKLANNILFSVAAYKDY